MQLAKAVQYGFDGRRIIQVIDHTFDYLKRKVKKRIESQFRFCYLNEPQRVKLKSIIVFHSLRGRGRLVIVDEIEKLLRFGALLENEDEHLDGDFLLVLRQMMPTCAYQLFVVQIEIGQLIEEVGVFKTVVLAHDAGAIGANARVRVAFCINDRVLGHKSALCESEFPD